MDPIQTVVTKVPVMAYAGPNEYHFVEVELQERGIIDFKNAADKIKAVGKDKLNTQQNFKYRGIESIMNAISEPLDEAGITITPLYNVLIELHRFKIKDNDWVYKEYQFIFRLKDKSGNFADMMVVSGAADNGDKLTGKVNSYAFKALANCVFNIPYSDDPDGESPPAPPKTQETGVDTYVKNQKNWKKEESSWLNDITPMTNSKTKAEFAKAMNEAFAKKLMINKQKAIELNEHLAKLDK